MSEEIEFQLEQGFERGEMMAVMLGQRLAGLVSLISSAINNVQRGTGRLFDTDAFTAVVAEGVVRRLCHEYFKVPSAHPLTAEQLAEAETKALEWFERYMERFGDMVSRHVASMSHGPADVL